MIILVIGNGFDLAHELPTSYPQFLEFVKMYKTDGESTFPDDGFHMQLSQLMNRLRFGDDQTAKEAQRILTKNNRLIDYFLSVYEKRCQEGKNGWIDFEAELAEIIKAFDDACEWTKAAIERGEKKYSLPEMMLSKIAPFIFVNGDYRTAHFYQFPLGLLQEFADKLLDNLNDVTRLFEIYLTEYVEKIDLRLRIPDIYQLGDKVDAVISFNYTDTYRRFYRGTEAVDCCFIHGKADADKTVETTNLVLGINEFLGSNREDSDNAFIWFKKFYQRIYKETDSEYIDWLDDDIEEKKDKEEKLPSYIYFYGHSLDETDKDVLKMLIDHEYAVIRIFYHNKEAMAKQIANLVKIIGRKELIRLTRGRDRKISFIYAKPAQDEAFCKMEK